MCNCVDCSFRRMIDVRSCGLVCGVPPAGCVMLIEICCEVIVDVAFRRYVDGC